MSPHYLQGDRPDDEMVTIDADCFHETSMAWGITVVPLGTEKETELWLPKSQCKRESENRFSVPVWLAEKHNLI